MTVTEDLNAEETMLVETVRAFIDRDVKPTVQEIEHANTYPEAWIEQMKQLGSTVSPYPRMAVHRYRCRAMRQVTRNFRAAG